MPTDDYGWENHRWKSEFFRLAHLELFNQDRFMVVHLCIFPHVNDPRPIFGFDVITGENKATGAFMDLSPTVCPSKPFSNLNLEKQRVRPEWGDIFSENWIACRPKESEMVAICDESVRVLDGYLRDLMDNRRLTNDSDAVVRAQNRYCLQQRRNEHTVRAIKNLLGDDRANEFITEVLFPTV